VRIACVGGGPAGLYVALLAKLRHPEWDVEVVERNPAGSTYGWGVVFWDDLLDLLYRNDAESAAEVERTAYEWDGQQVALAGGRIGHLGGYGYAIGRARLLKILARRAEAVGVDLRYEQPVDDPAALDADLVVAADGANSVVRERLGGFGTTTRTGNNRYIWLGTDKSFDTFTFAFEHTPAGWMWCHAYAFAPGTSTFIVECAPQTWEGNGFAELGPDDSTAALEKVFAEHLDGRKLIDRSPGLTAPSRWLTFRQITNRTWRNGNVVLMGDAAHTTHFSVGAGTRLALRDAVELADQVGAHDDLDAALTHYDVLRRTAMAPKQAAALASMEWFEHATGPDDDDVVDFAFGLWSRRGEYPAWRHGLHRATQFGAVRKLRHEVGGARRAVRARQRRRDGR
jgi:anthraniloyl-CoA monooxygenase